MSLDLLWISLTVREAAKAAFLSDETTAWWIRYNHGALEISFNLIFVKYNGPYVHTADATNLNPKSMWFICVDFINFSPSIKMTDSVRL